jgi:hypothetical protein
MIAALFSEAVKVSSHDSVWSKHEGVDHRRSTIIPLNFEASFYSRGASISIFRLLGHSFQMCDHGGNRDHQAVMRSSG